jgi:dienelactone hydrolase
MYTLEPQEGDARLIVMNVATGATDTVARGTGARCSENSAYALFTVKALFADVKKAKIAKKKPDEMPKDSLGILALGTHNVVRIPRVKSFKLPEKGFGWVAYQLEKEIPPADTTKKGKGKSKGDAPDDQGDDKKEEKGTTVVIRELASGREYTFPFARDYALTKDGTRLLVTTTGNDSTQKPGVFAFSTATRTVDTLASGPGSFRLPAWDEKGNQAAFVAHRDTSKSKQRYFGLWYWNAGKDSAHLLTDTLTRGMYRHWLVSENGPLNFSKDGTKLFFGTAPVPMPDDTTMNDVETARLDIWSWQDPLIQPQQLKMLDQDKKRTYTGVMHLTDRIFVQLGDTALPAIETGDEGNSLLVLGSSTLPYQRQQTWEGTSHTDIVAVDVRTGSRRSLLTGIRGDADLSPGGRYAYWFDWKKQHWFAMPLTGGTPVNLTASVKVPLGDEENDIPDDASPYGIAGWIGKDSLLLVYDRYDIWVTDPAGGRPAWCLTRGEGRTSHCSYRYMQLDPEERFIAPGATMYLTAFNDRTKMDGFAVTTTDAQAAPKTLLLSPYEYGTLARAKRAPRFIFTRGNFRECHDLYVSDTTCSTLTRISNANPRMGEYLWGTAELVTWKAGDRKPIEGLLYKPEGFDPKKQYPMVVYYYERNSNLLYHWYTPAPSASTVNIPLYVSRGYLVFVPDIRYRVGHPGQSAYECIVPGVKSLIARGFVNKARIGIQGQSWGGYQTAFLVTRTSMFRAAEAGAPVANMTSAYGGIRWGTGLARLFQYEMSQSRIGHTLWERPDLFIENSPLFRADSVHTPLLIMHNDADGAVPWYQGIEFFNALRRLNRPVWMLTYNSEDHNLVQRKNRKDLSIRMLQFFDHYLMDKPAPRWMTEGLPALIKGKTLRYELTTPPHGSE